MSVFSQISTEMHATTHILKSCDRLVDVSRRVLVQLLVVAEDDDGDIDGAQDGELMRLLEEAAFALEEGDGSVAVIADCIGLEG